MCQQNHEPVRLCLESDTSRFRNSSHWFDSFLVNGKLEIVQRNVLIFIYIS